MLDVIKLNHQQSQKIIDLLLSFLILKYYQLLKLFQQLHFLLEILKYMIDQQSVLVKQV